MLPGFASVRPADPLLFHVERERGGSRFIGELCLSLFALAVRLPIRAPDGEVDTASSLTLVSADFIFVCTTLEYPTWFTNSGLRV